MGLKTQSHRLSQLVALQTPDALIDALQPRLDHFHLYTFGGIKRTASWLAARQAKTLTTA